MKKKTIGIVGPGNHFLKKIYPVLIKSKFFQIKGILRNSNKSFKNLPIFKDKEFFDQNFDLLALKDLTNSPMINFLNLNGLSLTFIINF